MLAGLLSPKTIVLAMVRLLSQRSTALSLLGLLPHTRPIYLIYCTYMYTHFTQLKNRKFLVPTHIWRNVRSGGSFAWRGQPRPPCTACIAPSEVGLIIMSGCSPIPTVLHHLILNCDSALGISGWFLSCGIIPSVPPLLS